MLNETFTFDGIDMRTLGLVLQRPIAFEPLQPIVKKWSVPGRNGELTMDTGAFKNRKAVADCYVTEKPREGQRPPEILPIRIDRITAALFNNSGYRRLECSNDPEHFWMARIESGIEIAPRGSFINAFSLKFDCMPQRFRTDGDEVIGVSSTATDFMNSGTGTAKPIIRVPYDLSLRGKIRFSHTDGTEDIIDIINMPPSGLAIDCESQVVTDAYGNSAEDMIRVTKFPEFPALSKTRVSIDGKFEARINPRWWDK